VEAIELNCMTWAGWGGGGRDLICSGCSGKEAGMKM
jgi:hypothetical protein